MGNHSMRKTLVSNDLFVLSKALKQHLDTKDLFNRKIVVIPSNKLKTWVQQRLITNQNDVLINVEMIEIKQLTQLFEGIYCASFPFALGLYQMVYKKLKDLLSTDNRKTIYAELINYLNNLKNRSQYIEKLSLKLMKYFLEYGIYFDLAKKKNDHWQFHLLNEIYNEYELANPFKTLQETKPVIENIQQIHLFKIDYLPPLYHEALNKISERIDVYDYHYSFTNQYYDDALTDVEKIKMLRIYSSKKPHLDSYEEIKNSLSFNHPISSNWGKIAREYSKLFEEIEQEEQFTFPKSNTLLSTLQGEIFADSNSINQERALTDTDDSITFNRTHSKLREVEVLYDFICGHIQNHHYTPQDFLILAPDITAYASQIHLLFSNSPIPYKIYDYCQQMQSSKVQAVIQFFDLIGSKWPKEKLLALIGNPAFYKKHKLNIEEVEKIKSWIEKANIIWGKDAKEREKILHPDARLLSSHIHSWLFGLQRIIYGFVVNRNSFDEDQKIYPLDGISHDDHDTFDKLLNIILNLFEDIDYLQGNPSLTTREFKSIFSNILENYFLESKEEEFVFQQFFNQLDKAALSFTNESFSFNSFLQYFMNQLKKRKSIFNPNKINCLDFASIDISVHPAKVICFLGMNEDFPSAYTYDSMNLLLHQSRAYYPLKNDLDRFSLLQGLLLAKDKIYFSYVSESLRGSYLLTELQNSIISVLSRNSELNAEKLITNHCVSGDDPNLWHQTQKSYVYYQYLMAKKDFLSLPSYEPNHINAQDRKTRYINLDEMRCLAKNPIRYVYNYVAGIYFDDELLQDKEKTEIHLSALDRYLTRREMLQQGADQTMLSTYFKGKLAYGVMGDIVQKKLHEELIAYQEGLDRLQIASEDIVELDISFAYEKVTRLTSGNWGMPAVECEINNEKYCITGIVRNISPGGLIFHSEKKWEKCLKIWPEYLLYLHFCSMKKEYKKALVFSKGTDVISMVIDNPIQSLSFYLSYMQKVRKGFLPLVDLWDKQLLLSQEVDYKTLLMQKINSPFAYKDPYMMDFVHRVEEYIIDDEWKKQLKDTFEPLLEQQNYATI